MLVGRPCPSNQVADFLHDPGAKRDEVTRRKPVGSSGRAGGRFPHCGGRNDVRSGASYEKLLGEPAPFPLSSFLDEVVGLQCIKVVADLLAG